MGYNYYFIPFLLYIISLYHILFWKGKEINVRKGMVKEGLKKEKRGKEKKKGKDNTKI